MISERLRKALTEVRPLPIRYTADNLEFMPEDANRSEIIGGKFFASRAMHLDHQRTVTNFIVFSDYLRKNSIGEIFATPGVIFSPKNAVIPDLVFAARETVKNAVAGEEEKFEGKFTAAPELLIEILSYGKKTLSATASSNASLTVNTAFRNIG